MPITKIHGCPSAAPATASTLSRLIETSAIIIWIIAWRSVFGLASTAASTPPCPPTAIRSRYIFQQTHSSSTPPASSNPMMASNCSVTAPKAMRITVAPTMPQMIAGRR